MFIPDKYEIMFLIAAFLFQIILIIHFSLRKWKFDLAIRYGPIVYAISVPAAVISAIIWLSGKEWYFGVSGFTFLIWAAYGYYTEYIKQIEWRNSLRWSTLGPYVTLYLATVMFYWWPLAFIYIPLWYGYAVLFLISTYLNVTSHQKNILTLKESQS